ncbi:3-(3-hydroxy-phenyl)propionate transporter [Pandoraea iniqua]|uniref:3-(3-hydroxy-phenyl)propionate transporter MhpT n=1 Tax=Pandoraea iniqua TaxID=2508288 RepID=UPI00123FA085|nr:3-(3-hydroxy-phenyl)propionate transporter MhpT [Pandoraea iniqua]VVD82566.1 3-(3-hydroxy-phenyl)propionate transporter [Pandoraea iniqua]
MESTRERGAQAILPAANEHAGSTANTVVLTLGLCFAVALLEGLDLQSVGVAARGMAKEFGLSVAQMGIAFSAGTFGLLPGAMVGGRLADSIGRKRVLMLSAALFGVLSIATAFVSDFWMLVIVRVLTGIGLGGAMPNLIALSSEAVAPRLRGTAVSIMYCGIPLGGGIAATIGMLAVSDADWRHIFYVGGVGPLLLLPLLAMFLPESKAFAAATSQGQRTTPAPFMSVLFSEGRGVSTVQLWLSYFCTLIVLYFLLNWLPSLMGSRGLARGEIGWVQILFNVGSAVGVLCLGLLMDRVRMSVVIGGMYLGMIASLIGLAAAQGFAVLATAAFFAGMFIIGGQSVLYALAAAYYPTAMRGTGVGAAVAIGRIGSVVGPLAAGMLLAVGSSAAVVIGASVPVVIVAALAALTLIRRPRAAD